MNIYDVLVVGAGPAGAHCARRLAHAGARVLLIEKQKEIGEPNFSTAGTPQETFQKFNLPETLAPYQWNNFCLASPGLQIFKNLAVNCGKVFDFRALKQWLSEDAARAGAEISVSTSADEPLFGESGQIIGIKGRGPSSSGEIRAKITVDASGSAGALTNKLNLINPQTRIFATGVEVELTPVKFPYPNCLYFYLGDSFVPNGYGWIFPMSQDKAKVGLARYMTRETKPLDLNKQLNRFIASIGWVKDAEPIEYHGGTIIFDPSAINYVKSGFIGIGSSVAQVNPLGGEGIRHGLQAAEFAAQVIMKSLKSGDSGEKSLSVFNKLWLDYSLNNWKECYVLAQQVYKNTRDDRTGIGLKVLNNFSGDEIFEMLFHYDFNKYAGKAAKNIIKEGVT